MATLVDKTKEQHISSIIDETDINAYRWREKDLTVLRI